MHVDYHYFTVTWNPAHCPSWICHLETLLVVHLLHLGNPMLNDQIPRRSSCGCGFQQLTALLHKACDCSIGFFQSGFLLLVLLWDFCSYLSSSGFQTHAWRDEVVHGRPRFRPGIGSLVFCSQLCPLLMAWLESIYILFLISIPCHV